MAFCDQITLAPIARDAGVAAETRAAFAGWPAALQDLVAGAAGSAPFLDLLLRREGDWLRDLANRDADAIFDSVLNELPVDPAISPAVALRQAKRRVALICALADLGGVWDLEQVTGALTRFADRAVQVALRHLFLAELARGRMPDLTAEDVGSCGGMFVLAMGKMGALELNYSSDIDLICLFDEDRHAAENLAEIRRGFVRITQGLIRMLSEVTEQGYVLRTDLRLRPDPSVTPVCFGADAAERYYESFGRTWERAAFIKARVCGGDMAAGEAFLKQLLPFVWRRHLDFVAIGEAHDMRLRIREHKGIGERISIPGFNLKLGPGGIREIEFFAQTRQLICGGRDAGLRHRGTLAALAALAEKGWIAEGDAAKLSEAYREYRRIEHRIQMTDDAQTHALPEQDDKRARLAALCGEGDLARFDAGLLARLEKVRDLTEQFFGDRNGQAAKAEPDEFFARPGDVRAMTERWERLPALRSERARQIFHRLLPDIFARMGQAADPDEACQQFDAFLGGLPAGVQLFALFEANRKLLDLLVDICATAPGLAQYLGQNSAVFDAVLGRDFFAPQGSVDDLQAGFDAVLDAAGSYEQMLDLARSCVKEQQFRTGVQMLRQVIAPQEAGEAYSRIAEACLRSLLPRVAANLATRHGPMPGRGAVVLAMGKFASGEMSVSSDLDLIMVYDADGTEQSAGPRPLFATQYYARLTQALVSALSVQTAQGAIYKIDLRLRPSGQKGPVAVSLDGFSAYQRDQAWTWEHMALCRARVVAGQDGLARMVEAAIGEALGRPKQAAKVLADLAEMRSRLAEANAEAEADIWEVKLGRGRLLDIEMLLQAGMLLHYVPLRQKPKAMLEHLAACGWLGSEQAARLAHALTLFADFQQVARLGVQGKFSAAVAGHGLLALLDRVCGAEAGSLPALLAAASGEAAAIVDGVVTGEAGAQR